MGLFDLLRVLSHAGRNKKPAPKLKQSSNLDFANPRVPKIRRSVFAMREAEFTPFGVYRV